MEIVSREIRGKRIDIPIYTEEEARELGLDAVPWVDAQPGQWGITDDGYAMECKFRKKYTALDGCSRDYYRFSAGRTWSPRKKPFNFETIRANRAYSRTSGEQFILGETRRSSVKSLIHQAAIQRITRGIYDYKQLSGVYNHDASLYHTIPQVKGLLRSRRVKHLIREEIEKLLVGGGMTIADWVKLGERAFEKADAEDNVAEMRRIWEKWGEFLAIKEVQSREILPTDGHQVLEAITEEIKQLPPDAATNGG